MVVVLGHVLKSILHQFNPRLLTEELSKDSGPPGRMQAGPFRASSGSKSGWVLFSSLPLVSSSNSLLASGLLLPRSRDCIASSSLCTAAVPPTTLNTPRINTEGGLHLN